MWIWNFGSNDKIADSSNFEPKPPGFWKNNVKERY